MTKQRFTTAAQPSLAILLVVGVFAGGMAIAQAADRPAFRAVEVANSTPLDDHAYTDPCVWTPSDAEIARNAEDTAELAAALDRFGIRYVSAFDELGFVWLEFDLERPCRGGNRRRGL